MKKILSLVLVFALAFVSVLPAFALEAGKYSSTSLKAVEFKTQYDPETPNVKLVGRTNPLNPLLFGIHASGVEFNVTGTTTVGVRIQSYNNSHNPIPLYFEVNGEQVVVTGAESTTQGTYDYIIRTDLDVDTTYNVKVLQDQESWAQYKYHGFYITHAVVDDVANANVSKAKDGDYKILVLGDSITSARNIGGVHLSYHQLMAKNFNADTQVLSAGGGLFGKGYKKNDGTTESDWQIRIAKDWNAIAWENSEYKMPEMYDADGVPGRDSYETDPNKVNFKADLVFINIGTNDFNKGYISSSNANVNYNKALFKEQLYAMLDEMLGVGNFKDVGGYYPDATVMLACNLMPVGSYIKDFYAEVVAAYLADRPELGKNANGKDRVSVYIFKDTGSDIIGSRWDDLTSQQVYDQHPNATGHAIAAERLTDDIAEYMGWKVKPTDRAYPNNDGILEELPEVERKDDQLFLGFTDDNDSYVKKGGTIAWGSYIYSKYLNVTLGGKVVSAVNENDPNPIRDMTATYTNGFYIQGAQVRVGLTPQDKATGLRFIVVNNTEIKTALETAITNNLNYERGVMVISGKKYKGGALEVNTENATKVEAKNIFASTTTLQANYDKYTACIINIPEEHFSTQVLVRPYFKYTDNSGVEHVYYGEQYSCSLFAAARVAYGKESDAVNEYLYNTIISKCKGDNDTQIQF